MNPTRRLDAVRRIMVAEGVDAFVVASPANVIYLTGFESVFDEEPCSVCVITFDTADVYVDARYAEAAIAAAGGGSWTVVGPEADVWDSALTSLDDRHCEAFGLESSVPHCTFVKASNGREGRVRDANGWVERVRVVKEAAEIERISAAAALTDAAFDHILGVVRPGMSETEIALELEVFMRRNGSDGLAFSSIVASGPNSSRPHAKLSARALEHGDLLTMDFGARVKGYCSDMTRTVAIGALGEEGRAIYEIVLAANEAGLAAVRAGRTGAEIDAEARRVIDAAGFKERFGHGLGHGVGIEVHEAPNLGPRGAKVIDAGAVVTVEPGVYVARVGGVRIEDLVVVRENGATVLSHSPKHLIEL